MTPGPAPGAGTPPEAALEPGAEQVDARGLLCPLPILRAAQRIAALAPGARLELVGDDPGILEDLPAWCEQTGHRLLRLERRETLIHGLVEKR